MLHRVQPKENHLSPQNFELTKFGTRKLEHCLSKVELIFRNRLENTQRGIINTLFHRYHLKLYTLNFPVFLFVIADGSSYSCIIYVQFFDKLFTVNFFFSYRTSPHSEPATQMSLRPRRDLRDI